MSAFIVARIAIWDWERYRDYMQHTPRVIAQHGGRFLIRGGESVKLEGEDDGRRTVVIEFPSLADAKAFYHSPEYTAVRALRAGAGEGVVTAIDGYDPSAWDAAVSSSNALEPPAP